MTPISTGNFYYFPEDDSIWMITDISSRIGLILVVGNHSSSTSLLPEYINLYGRYLGNLATTPTSQLTDFYPELFI